MKLYFATPTYKGEHPAHVASRVLTRRALGDSCEFFFARGDSCLSRARSTLLAGFLAEPEWTHLVQVDDDQSWGVDHLVELVGLGLPLVGLRSAFKSDEPRYAGRCTTRFLEERTAISPDGTVPVEYLGGGFILWRRDVLEAMARAFPECGYDTNIAGTDPRPTFSFWAAGGVRGRELLSEDYWATHLATRAGYTPRVWLRACSPHWLGERAYVPEGYAQPRPERKAA